MGIKRSPIADVRAWGLVETRRMNSTVRMARNCILTVQGKVRFALHRFQGLQACFILWARKDSDSQVLGPS